MAYSTSMRLGEGGDNSKDNSKDNRNNMDVDYKTMLAKLFVQGNSIQGYNHAGDGAGPETHLTQVSMN